MVSSLTLKYAIPRARHCSLAICLKAICAGVALVALMWLPLSACTSEKAAQSGTDSSQRQATVANDVKPFVGKRLTHLTITSHRIAAESLAKWFREETGAVIEVQVVDYGQIRARTAADQQSERPQFDVFIVYYRDLPFLVEQRAFADLTDYIATNRQSIDTEDFIADHYDAYTLYRGRRWALPFDGDTHVLFYRKSLLGKHGLAPPETWDDYLQVSKTITEAEKQHGIYGSAIMLTPVSILTISSFMNRLVAHGGDLLSADNVPMLNTPEAHMALAGLVEQARYALPTPLETDFDVSRLAFLTGRVAMVEQWTDIGVMAEDARQSSIRGDWGAVHIPTGSGPKARRAAAMNAGFSLAVAKNARDPELARAFVHFATRRDILLRLNLIPNSGCDPVRLSTLHAQEYKDFAPDVSRAKMVSLEQLVSWPRLPEAPELMDELTNYVRRAVAGTLSPEQALAQAQARWEEILRPEPGHSETRRPGQSQTAQEVLTTSGDGREQP